MLEALKANTLMVEFHEEFKDQHVAQMQALRPKAVIVPAPELRRVDGLLSGIIVSKPAYRGEMLENRWDVGQARFTVYLAIGWPLGDVLTKVSQKGGRSLVVTDIGPNVMPAGVQILGKNAYQLVVAVAGLLQSI